MEPDHAGNIAVALDKYPNLQVVASARAIQMMPQFFEDTNFEGRTIAVKEGETLSLGEHTLQFFMAPMVHWPEVMVTYDQTDKIVFSADGFGKFGALAHEEEWACEARRYYFNICGKYGVQVQALLKKLATLDVACICPLHGPILKENLGYYIGLYDTWSKYEVETEGVFIAYASIHGGTRKAAEKMADILRQKGAPKVSIADLTRDDMAEAVEDAFRMGKLIVAAASYDADVFPPMYDFLHHLKLKAYQKRRVGIIENGSWAPAATKTMKAMLEGCKNLDYAENGVKIVSALNDESRAQIEALAEELAALYK
jgi:flavorubredoxin